MYPNASSQACRKVGEFVITLQVSVGFGLYILQFAMYKIRTIPNVLGNYSSDFSYNMKIGLPTYIAECGNLLPLSCST